MMTSRQILSFIAIIPLLILFVQPARAQEQGAKPAPVAETQLQQSRQQLQDIQKTLQDKRSQVEQLRKQLAREKNESERQDLQQRIEQEDTDIANLRRSFENIALGGIDLGVFDTERQDEKFNWQQELQLILKPLFQELKQLTEKPRQMERLNSRLAALDNQQRVAERVLNNIKQLQDENLDKATRQRLEELRQHWVQRLDDIQREREISQLQLDTLLEDKETILTQIGQSMNKFLTGRGLNLVLAIAAFFLTMFLMKGLYTLSSRLRTARTTRTTTGRRILAYSYQALTLFLSILAALLVLYLAGDILLLVLVLILLLFILLGLRNYLPRFIEETKLLLNVGAVRERERVVYRELPWLVRSLGVYSKLYNPALEGLLRLPLSEMLQLVSRPYREDEPWFPTRTGDWVKMSDDTVGQVLRQTPEIVQLKTRNTIRTYTTTNFLASEPRNLMEGFGITITFGIDYQHQAISTTEVPKILHQSIEQALQQTELAQHVDNILVEFQEAGASSLNYLIYVTMQGAAADSYYPLNRLLQRVCVETCNEHGWVIPFNQVTLHAGSGFNTFISSDK